MILNYKIYGDGKNTLVIAHGLFGTLDNFHSLSSAFADKGIKIVALDMRNHGRSPHSDSNSYSDMANDIIETLNSLSIKSPILLGHSMGGKAVINLVANNPKFAKALIVADIAPKAYNPKHDTIIEALKSVDLVMLKERKLVEEHLSKFIPDSDVVQFLMKNLSRRTDGDGFKWKINLEVLVEYYSDIIGDFEIKNPIQIPTLFIRGINSNYINNHDMVAIKEIFSDVSFVDLNAGHWVHAEDKEGFYNAVLGFINVLNE